MKINQVNIVNDVEILFAVFIKISDAFAQFDVAMFGPDSQVRIIELLFALSKTACDRKPYIYIFVFFF